MDWSTIGTGENQSAFFLFFTGCQAFCMLVFIVFPQDLYRNIVQIDRPLSGGGLRSQEFHSRFIWPD